MEQHLGEFTAHLQEAIATDAASKKFMRVIDRLPTLGSYPEALHDTDLDTVVRHFLPHIEPTKHASLLLHALYNPLNIESVAREMGVTCPDGFSYNEMLHRNETVVPCVRCNGPAMRYKGIPFHRGVCHLCVSGR